MEFNISGFKNVLIKSFEESHKLPPIKDWKYQGEYKSSVFLSKLSESIHKKFFGDLTLNAGKYNSEKENSSKSRNSEWLFDMCITDCASLKDEKKTKIYNKIIFALECEWCSGIDDFAKDFGKILCCNAKYRVFISGLTQQEEPNRIRHIDNLLEALEPLKSQLNDIILVFCPSPLIIGNGKNGKKSLWNLESNNIEKLKEMISFYTYDSATCKLVKC